MTADHIWTLKESLEWTLGYLDGKGDEHPRRSAEWLLSAATGLSRVEIYAYHDRPLTPQERAALREGVKRRAGGQPLQYVTGEMAFRHLVVRVVPGVFIPRPETETLVDEGLEFLRGLSQPKRPKIDPPDAGDESQLVIDLCTGSGAIACSMAQEHPSSRVLATDLSALAVATATANAERLGLSDRVEVFDGDLFSPLEIFAVERRLLGQVDLVISNPPYIPSSDLPDLPQEVLGFEPHLALDGGPDGLVIARRIMEESTRWLRPQGMLAIELDEGCVQIAVKQMSEWYEGIRTVRDLAGRDRVAIGYLRK
ncbi:MAG: peptide chain release factor N(5)-glutamine methyltransferase [Coriobacteriia bacterium]|nr:peptide chain release factor N(5)-glutamine methyltransferase [Coriobacteriia bacterium]